MKWILVSAGLLAIASISPAEAKGCIKGAVVGGVAGHMAGHGKLGAAAGCAIGHHEAHKSGSSAKKPRSSLLVRSERISGCESRRPGDA